MYAAYQPALTPGTHQGLRTFQKPPQQHATQPPFCAKHAAQRCKMKDTSKTYIYICINYNTKTHI